MKGEKFNVGLDIGSRTIKLVVSLNNPQTGKNEIVGATKEKSEGIIGGQIVSHRDALKCIKSAIQKTEKALDIKIEKVNLGISTICTKHTQIRIKNSVARSSNEVGELDFEKAKDEALRSVQMNSPLQVLHTNLSFVYLDGKRVRGSALGMIAHSIETVFTVTTIPKATLESFIKLFEELGVELVEIHHNGFINSIPLTSSRDRFFGVAVLDIGSETSLLTVYENDLPVLASTFTIGGNAFTKDISIGMGVTIEQAEELKKTVKQNENKYDSRSENKKINNIIDARLDDLVFLIQKEMQKISKTTQTPNGIILSGGGSNLYNIASRLKSKLSIPVVEAKEILKQKTDNVLNDAVWTNAYALTFISQNDLSFLKTTTMIISDFFKKAFAKIAP